VAIHILRKNIGIASAFDHISLTISACLPYPRTISKPSHYTHHKNIACEIHYRAIEKNEVELFLFQEENCSHYKYAKAR
jgi:hypothetical protein